MRIYNIFTTVDSSDDKKYISICKFNLPRMIIMITI